MNTETKEKTSDRDGRVGGLKREKTDIPRKIRGVIVPMVTPVERDGRPDMAALARLTDWLLDAGVGGLFVGGTTGRFSHFTPEEIAGVCRSVVERVNGRVPVLGGICDSGLRRMQSNADLMADTGADYLVVTAPFYLRYSDAERESVLTKLIDCAPLPVVLYNIPDLVGAALRAEWILEIGRHPRVIGLKDSSNDFAFFERILHRRPREDFVLIQGKEPLLARSMLAGADGLVVSLAHMNPKIFVTLCRAAWAGDRRTAEQCQAEIQRFYDDIQLAVKKAPFFSELMRFLERGMVSQGMTVRLLEDLEIRPASMQVGLLRQTNPATSPSIS